MRFLVLLSVSSFLNFSKNLNFNSKFGRHSFSVNLLISKVIFSQHELHFCFHNSINFCSRLRSAISLAAQVQFQAKYPLFDSQLHRGFTFSCAILIFTTQWLNIIISMGISFSYYVKIWLYLQNSTSLYSSFVLPGKKGEVIDKDMFLFSARNI